MNFKNYQTMKRLLLLGILIFIQTAGIAQILDINIPEHRFRIDPYDHIIVVQSFDLEQYSDLSSFEEINLNLASFEFQFTSIPGSLELTGSYTVSNETEPYHLFFTHLPLLKINSVGTIWNGAKVPAEFLYADEDGVKIENIGINFLMSYLSNAPKRSYSLEFWTDSASGISTDIQFSNLNAQSGWVLNSMYNDPLRLRTYASHKLWLDIHQPSYLNEAPEARAGSDGIYVELFENGHYRGIYFLCQEVNRSLLDIEAYDDNQRGELYKGKQAEDAVIFESVPEYSDTSRYWAGYKMKYPLEEQLTDWQNLFGFTDFVLNSTDTGFDTIWNTFDYQNYLDYFIFLNMTRTADNTGKNIFLAKYDSGTPYFYVPWQLNGSFGTIWDGTILNITDDILTNGFMDRVIDTDVLNYTADVEARWAELRTGPLHSDSLEQGFAEAHQLLLANNIYEREALVFPNYPFATPDFDYLMDWIADRIVFLDIYFNYQPVSVREWHDVHFEIYPNPAQNSLYITTSENLINTHFQIIDITGKIVQSGKYQGEPIRVSELNPGLYFLTLGSITQKVVIQ